MSSCPMHAERRIKKCVVLCRKQQRACPSLPQRAPKRTGNTKKPQAHYAVCRLRIDVSIIRIQPHSATLIRTYENIASGHKSM